MPSQPPQAQCMTLPNYAPLSGHVKNIDKPNLNALPNKSKYYGWTWPFRAQFH